MKTIFTLLFVSLLFSFIKVESINNTIKAINPEDEYIETIVDIHEITLEDSVWTYDGLPVVFDETASEAMVSQQENTTFQDIVLVLDENDIWIASAL